MVSSFVTLAELQMTSAWLIRFMCVSSAPFGRPVVPEV